ncbi:HEAT repeat domain-containing protein [Corallococcus exiguus]|uniref:HEAT repeat domain-containing protein n=1 Tax=Corallococcus exiguus TaxID=83462 RepID=UPI0015612AE0|nr:HEAT repeat domain-containing protein [Corallococcus exiguus]NRD60831.1 HEAT repeat domain-containing protein [Corallococcus exiguus]
MPRQILTLWLCATMTLGNLAQAAQTQQAQDVSPRLRGLLAALDDPSGQVAAGALQLLIKEKRVQDEQIPRLGRMLKDPNPQTRLDTAQALGVLGKAAKQHAPLLTGLLRDPDVSVRQAAAEALGAMGEAAKDQAPLLVDMLKDPKDSVRIAAAFALSEMGKSAQDQTLRLTGLLKDQHGGVRAAAVQVLVAIGKVPKEEAPRLGDLLKDPKESVRVRYAATEALGALGAAAKEQIPLLVGMLKDPHSGVRMAAVRALGNMGEAAKEQAPLLVGMLKDPDSDVREAAVRALGNMGEAAKEQAPLLVGMLNFFNEKDFFEGSGSAAKALGAMGEAAKEQAPLLVDMLKHPDWSTVIPAMQALDAMGKAAREQAPRISNMLKDPTAFRRAIAAELLGGMGEAAKEHAPLLTGLLKDPSAEVRQSAAKALGAMGEAAKEQAPYLAGLLKDPNERVRDAAVQALKSMGKASRDQAPHIVGLLKDPDKDVRRSAAMALGAMGESAKEQAPDLAGLLEDSHEDVRLAAAKALSDMGEFDRKYAHLALELLENETDQDDYEARGLLMTTAPLELQQVVLLLAKASTDPWEHNAWLLCAHVAGGGEPPVERVLRWLPKRAFAGLPTELTLEEARETMHAFAVIWQHTEKYPGLREDLAEQIARVASLAKGQWTLTDDKLLGQHQSNLRASYPAHAERLQAIRSSLDSWGRVKTFAWTWVGHLCFWLLLLFVYPRSPQVQAVFFWNPWVRTITGFGYVGLLLTWVPILRRRLLAPFANQFLADADLERFPKESYFHGSQVFIPSTGRSVPLLSAVPQLRGQVVLEGASGLGKSLFIRYLLRHSKQLTVFLPAERCREGVLEAIQAKLEGHAKDTAFLQSIIYSGALDIYIDGLNEVTADTRARIVQFVERNFHGNILLATQRMEWTPPITARLYVLQPLSDAQVSEFLASREVLLGEKARLRGPEYLQSCERFVQRVLAPEQPEELRLSMREVLSNPMDLTVIAQMLGEGHSPDLFRLRQQQYELMARDYLEVNLAEFPLNGFAEECHRMRLEDRPSLPEERFGKELLRLESFKIVVRRQWKGPDGREHREWRFRHDKLQEFFIAQALLGQGNPRIAQHMDDPRFRGVYFLLALLMDPESAHQLRDRLVVHAARTRDHSVSDEFVTLLEARRKSEQLMHAPPPRPQDDSDPSNKYGGGERVA